MVAAGCGGNAATSDPPRVGSLPRAAIQSVVRKNFGWFRLCYEDGLRRNPSLQGRVLTAVVIGRTGAVETTSDAGSDLPDPQVVSCVVRSFRKLTFPPPEGDGNVSFTYPIMFNPGADVVADAGVEAGAR
jgi:hypothetical protein